MKRLKHLDFLIDILVLACTSFGGPQVHFALFLDRLVKKRAYLTEEELFEFNIQLAEESKQESILLKKMTKLPKCSLHSKQRYYANESAHYSLETNKSNH